MKLINKLIFHNLFMGWGEWHGDPCNGGGWVLLNVFYYNPYHEIKLITK